MTNETKEKLEKEAEEVANVLTADMVMVGDKAYYSKDAVIKAMTLRSKFDSEWFYSFLCK